MSYQVKMEYGPEDILGEDYDREFKSEREAYDFFEECISEATSDINASAIEYAEVTMYQGREAIEHWTTDELKKYAVTVTLNFEVYAQNHDDASDIAWDRHLTVAHEDPNAYDIDITEDNH